MIGYIAKHKKVLVLVVLFGFLFWLITAQVKSGRFFLEKPVFSVSAFFERIITGTYHAVGSTWRGYVSLVGTRRKNRRLREELTRLRLENQITEELLIENERLRKLLDFKNQPDRSSLSIRVIGKTVSPSSSMLTISKGAGHGIEKNMAVITDAGVVGRIQTVLANTAKVILITDPGNTLAVRVQRNREEGLLEGKISHCALKYVSFYADIQKGDLLVTSGLDGIYPKGLPVAMVTRVSKHEANPYQSVVAEPVVRFSRMEEALVLTK